MKTAKCYLCERETKYKSDKDIVCEYCTMELCKNLPRQKGESLELIKMAMEVYKNENANLSKI